MAPDARDPAINHRLAWSAETRAALALTCAALLWSGNFIVGRALRHDIDPFTLNLLRWVLCLLVFLPWVGARAWRCRRIVLREWRLLLALGVTGIASFHTLVYLALSTTSAINALLMLSLTPVAILVGAALTGARAGSLRQWPGVIVSLAGACVLLTRGDPSVLLDLTPARGDLWMIAAVLLWAAYSLLLRRRPTDLPPDVALAASIVPAIALLLPPAALAAVVTPPAFSLHLLAGLAYISVFASLVAFLLWSHGVAALGPERAGQFVHLMPVFGAVLAVVLLDEPIELAQLAGALCVFAGIALAERSRGQRPGPRGTAPDFGIIRPDASGCLDHGAEQASLDSTPSLR